MESNIEIRRLSNLSPASGKMAIKIISKPEQAKVIDTTFPLPWDKERIIYINFDLWQNLTKQQRDLIFLSKLSWLIEVEWFRPELNQGLAIAGIIGGLVESAQSDVVGIGVSLSLTAFAISNIWKKNKSQESQINADTVAIRIATRRGYTQAEAAEHLLYAIETITKLEKRSKPDFVQLIRTQNLRAIAGLSPVGIPKVL